MTGSKSEYELYSLSQLFQGGDRSFRIPDYQRGYSWETRQRLDLQKDIEYIIQNGFGYKHFTGTVVASKNEKQSQENGLETFDIVDGQQRLTTLVILLSVIGHKLQKTEIHCKYTGDQILESFVASGQGTGNTIRKFFSGREQDELFKNLILKGSARGKIISSKSEQNLVDALNEFHTWVNDENICDITKCVLDNLGFLLYAPQNDKEIGIMFEVINNRGKPLSQLEKIKNYVIYYADKNGLSDLKKQVHESWPHILNNLNKVQLTSNDQENSFLRNCWIVFGNTNKSKSYQVYDEVKSKWGADSKKSWQKLKDFILFLQSASLTYTKLILKEDASGPEKIWLNRIHHHPRNASMTPVLLAIYERIQTSEQRIELLELVEKLNFRFYVTGIAGRADSGQGDFFWWAHSLYNSFEQQNHWGELVDFHWLRDKIFDYINKHASDRKFIQHLTLDKDEGGDYYHWSGLKFFLASYEEKLRNEKKESLKLGDYLSRRDSNYSNDFYHKEHIWAANDLQVLDDSNDRNFNKRRLGNFILLKETQNIKVSNKRPEVKVKEYWEDRENDPNTLMIRELKGIFTKAVEQEKRKNRTWKYWFSIYQRFMDYHEEKLIAFALERWGIKDLASSVTEIKIDSFTPKNEVYHLKSQV